MYSIISIDGGGMMGIIPCTILAHLEKNLQDMADNPDLRLADCVDLFTGTSTGGIMSLAMTAPNANGRPRYSMQDLTNLYINEGNKIFDIDLWRQLSTGFGLRESKYSDSGLKQTMATYFDDMQLSHALKPTLVTSYDLMSQKAQYFRTHAAKEKPSADFYTRDAAIATASAPTYFPVAEIHNMEGQKMICVDGIMLAFNPTLIAYAELRRIAPSAKASNMLMLSFSTGHQHLDFDAQQSRNWGSLEWGSRFTDIMVDGVRQNVHYQVEQIYSGHADNYFRIEPIFPDSPKIDLELIAPL